MNLQQAYNEIIESNLNTPEERNQYLEDLTQHGAVSGMVGGLIYYTETTVFFDEHRYEIIAMLAELKEDTGLDESELFGDKWNTAEEIADDEFSSDLDSDDYDTENDYEEAKNGEYWDFVENTNPYDDMYNKNLLSWFAVETLAGRELEEAGVY